MITAVQHGDVYIIRFPYDPELVRRVKNVPGRQYYSDQKYWTIPADRLGFFVVQLQGTPYEKQFTVYSAEQINEDATLDATERIPNLDLSNVPLYIKDGEQFFPHQLDFMRYAIDRHHKGLYNGFILADQQGTGKTLELMNLALYNRQFNHTKHCLIIACVNSAKYNWIADIKKHTNGQEIPYLLGTRKKRDGTFRMEGSSEEKLEDLMCGHMYGDKDAPKLPYFIVMNIEAIRMIRNRKYPIRERLTTLLNKGYIGMIALDEAHRGMSATSKQGKQILKLKKDCLVRVEWVPMTGTPIVNRPTDVFVPLKLVNGHNFKNYYTWCQYFCVYGGFGNHDIIAYKHIPELKNMLQSNMIRRLKKDVLPFLPPKIRTVEYVENTPYQAKLYTQILKNMITHQDDILSAINPLAKFLRLRQVNGSPELIDPTIKIDGSYLEKNSKLIRLLDLVDSILANDEKVIIYSNWVEPLRTIYRFLAKDNKVCCYTGTMKPEVREQHKQQFVEDPGCHILIGTVGALGESHNLGVANNIIFYDLPWTPATIEQAEDRGHRPDSKKTVNVYFLITRNSVDEKVYDIVGQKDGVSKYIVDGELAIKNNPQLLAYLLGNDNGHKKGDSPI